MGRKREPRERPTIDADALIEALEGSEYCRAYLDVETGAVELVPVSDDDDLWGEPLVNVDGEPERWHEIEPIETSVQYRWMREFAAALDDAPDIAALLDVALEGRGAFGRFRGVLSRHPDLQARWDAFQSERALECAKAWLRREGLHTSLSLSTPRALAGPVPANTQPAACTTPEIGLVHVLLLGAPNGKTELLDGRVHRVITARDTKQADQLLRRLVRHACALQGIDYRRSLVDGRDVISIGELTFSRRGATVELAVTVPAAIWQAFS
jgi:hypothetical protein